MPSPKPCSSASTDAARMARPVAQIAPHDLGGGALPALLRPARALVEDGEAHDLGGQGGEHAVAVHPVQGVAETDHPEGPERRNDILGAAFDEGDRQVAGEAARFA